MKTNRGFDFLAPVYDSLARIIFGKSIVNSQIYFLNKVPPESRVLILGGGTGWLLDELQKYNSSCEVWYVEISSGMNKRARLRGLKNHVHIIQGTEEAIPLHLKFDVVITNFYLDLFSDKTLNHVIQRVNVHTTLSSIWLVSDFVNGTRWWQTGMLKIMYLFFRTVCKIEATQLPQWLFYLRDHKWKETNSKSWYGGFIKSVVLSR